MSSSINVHYRRRYHGIKIIPCLVVLLCIVISLTNGSSINNDNNNKKKTERIKAAEKKVKLAEAKLNRVKEEMTKAKMELKQSVDHLNKVSSSIVLKEEYKFQENKILSNEKVQKDMKEIEATEADQGNGLNAMLLAHKAYSESNGPLSENNLIMSNIIHYNQVDCKVLYEIITYLRENQ